MTRTDLLVGRSSYNRNTLYCSLHISGIEIKELSKKECLLSIINSAEECVMMSCFFVISRKSQMVFLFPSHQYTESASVSVVYVVDVPYYFYFLLLQKEYILTSESLKRQSHQVRTQSST